MLSIKRQSADVASDTGGEGSPEPSRWSPLRLGGLYLGAMFATNVVGWFVPVLLVYFGVVQLVCVLALGIIVARYRDDDALEAGVLVAVITGVQMLVMTLLAQVIETGTIWAAVAGIPVVFIQLTLRSATVGLVCAVLVRAVRAVWPRRARTA